MKSRILLICLAVTIVTMQSAYSNSERSKVKVVSIARWIDDVPYTQDAHHDRVYRYVLDALKSWAPSSTIVEDHDQRLFPAIARDITDVALDPGEPSIVKHDPDRWKQAIVLARVAYFEGHLWRYVDDGRCNRLPQSNALLANGSCDHGEAYSLWQIHPGKGIALFDNGLWGWHLDGGGITGDDLIRDRRLAAKTALHMMRASRKDTHSLCEYTGERHVCPKAKERWNSAMTWIEKHPLE